MEFEARGDQGRVPIIREGTAHRPALSPDDLGLGIRSAFELSCYQPSPYEQSTVAPQAALGTPWLHSVLLNPRI